MKNYPNNDVFGGIVISVMLLDYVKLVMSLELKKKVVYCNGAQRVKDGYFTTENC